MTEEQRLFAGRVHAMARALAGTGYHTWEHMASDAIKAVVATDAAIAACLATAASTVPAEPMDAAIRSLAQFGAEMFQSYWLSNVAIRHDEVVRAMDRAGVSVGSYYINDDLVASPAPGIVDAAACLTGGGA